MKTKDIDIEALSSTYDALKEKFLAGGREEEDARMLAGIAMQNMDKPLAITSHSVHPEDAAAAKKQLDSLGVWRILGDLGISSGNLDNITGWTTDVNNRLMLCIGGRLVAIDANRKYLMEDNCTFDSAGIKIDQCRFIMLLSEIMRRNNLEFKSYPMFEGAVDDTL